VLAILQADDSRFWHDCVSVQRIYDPPMVTVVHERSTSHRHRRVSERGAHAASSRFRHPGTRYYSRPAALRPFEDQHTMTQEHTTRDAGTPGCIQRRDIRPPQVFISSTFEDLLFEIRDQLRSELEAVNLLPLMSERGDFKYTYNNHSVITDTIQAAATSDFYVLVIGRHYGTPADRDHSVTELEYDAARAAGIPTFVYVQ
jgi:hypothetical protein